VESIDKAAIRSVVSSIIDKSEFQRGEEFQEDLHDDLVTRNEFYGHSKFTPAKIDHALLLFELEDMVNDKIIAAYGEDEEQVVFDDRSYSESLDADSFAQVLVDALRSFKPEVTKHFYAYNSSVLLALYTVIPLTRHISQADDWKSTVSIILATCIG
jgi:hypothetical protein